MTQEGKDKVITRSIDFISTNTKEDKHRIGQAIIAELELVKKLTIPDVSGSYLSTFLDYEIRSSWWASWIGFNYGQELLSRHFLWKAKRKHNRYLKSKAFERSVKDHR